MLYVSYLAANPGPETMVDLFPPAHEGVESISNAEVGFDNDGTEWQHGVSNPAWTQRGW